MSKALRTKVIEWFKKEYHREMYKLLHRSQVRDHGQVTDDANLLEGNHTYATLLKPARDILAAHRARVNNPHQETAATIGSLTRADTVSKVDWLANRGRYPFSWYGFDEFSSQADVAAAWTTDGWRVDVAGGVKAMMSGYSVVIPWRWWNLKAMYPQRHQNNTFAIGIRHRLNRVFYEITEIKRAPVSLPPPETYTYMHIGFITTDDDGISSINIERVVRIDAVRISENPAGSAFPRTSGNFTDTTETLKSGW